MSFMQAMYPTVRYMQDEVVNPPVNMLNVTHFGLAKKAYYPDNEGKPALKIHFVGGESVLWTYANEADREADRQRLLAWTAQGVANG